MKTKESNDLGDLNLQKGWPIQGRVVTGEGIPVAGIKLYARDVPGVRLDKKEGWVRFGVSGQDGKLIPASPIPPGTWPVEASGRGLALADPASILVPEGSPPAPITFFMRPLEAISGVVVDDVGNPVNGAYVTALNSKEGQIYGGTTGEAGSFSIFARKETPTDQPVDVRIQGETGPTETYIHPVPVAWGTRNLRIVVRRSATVHLEIVEEATGLPVQDYLASLVRPATESNLDFGAGRKVYGQVDGTSSFSHVLRGAYTVTVIPKRSDLLWVHDHPLQVDEGEVKLTLRLPAAASREVLVLGEGEHPIAGVTIELLDPRNAEDLVDGFLGGRLTRDPRASFIEGRNSGFQGNEIRVPLCFAYTTSDASGRALVHGPPGAGPLMLRLSGAGIIKQVVPGLFLQGPPEPIVVRVTKGAILSVTVRPLDILAYPEAGFLLKEVGGPGLLPSEAYVRGIPLDAAGRFRLDGIKPGTWRIRFRAAGVDHDTGRTLTLEPGMEQRLLLHMDDFVPARLTGRIVEPDPIPDSWLRPDSDGHRLQLCHQHERGSKSLPVTALARDGSFEMPLLLPGNYGLYLYLHDSSSPTGLVAAEKFHLEPGEHAVKEFRLGARKVSVQLVGAHTGSPLAGVEVRVRDRVGPYPALTTDPEGRILLPWFPFDTVWVAYLGQEFGPLEIPAGKEPALVIRVPE